MQHFTDSLSLRHPARSSPTTFTETTSSHRACCFAFVPFSAQPLFPRLTQPSYFFRNSSLPPPLKLRPLSFPPRPTLPAQTTPLFKRVSSVRSLPPRTPPSSYLCPTHSPSVLLPTSSTGAMPASSRRPYSRERYRSKDSSKISVRRQLSLHLPPTSSG